MSMREAAHAGHAGDPTDGECGLVSAAPATPFRQRPDVVFERDLNMDISKTFYVGEDDNELDFWGFVDSLASNDDFRIFPSPLIRVRQGEVVHTRLVSDHIHTIHHHGIEPTTHNDGVGHYSFDVDGTYTYQWYASQSGTYFYHCHVNTVLHVEMGMYGPLIIDPPTGPGTVEGDGVGNYLPYDVERIWAVDEVDSSWHDLDEHTALCGGDASLHRFTPDYFVINGVYGDSSNGHFTEQEDEEGDDVILQTDDDPATVVEASAGDQVLIRYIHAGYFPHRLQFPPQIGDVYTIAEDGRPLAVAELVPASGTVITSAERREFYFNPTVRGSHRVVIEIEHWITREVVGQVTTLINVA